MYPTSLSCSEAVEKIGIPLVRHFQYDLQKNEEPCVKGATPEFREEQHAMRLSQPHLGRGWDPSLEHGNNILFKSLGAS